VNIVRSTEMKKPSVLVVDDDPATLHLIGSVLDANGAVCVSASTGAQALQHVMAHPQLQLIISDIAMPEMDGLEFMKRLGELLARDRIPPVVFLTAHPSIDFAISALRLGATDFLIKPVQPSKLLAIFKRFVPARSAGPEPGKGASTARSGASKPEDPRSQALLGIDELRKLRRGHPVLSDLDDTESDLLLELLRAERAGRRLSVSALSISVDIDRVSSATALRRIQNLVRAGLIVRIPDPEDARRDFVTLAAEARSALDTYLLQVAEAFKAAGQMA
jgi:CheY-like chemotaxis protein/DNA-binding MarR family transcriptional regulator